MMLSILFPVYNEKKRLRRGITKTIAYLNHISFDEYEILIVDNASTDATPWIGRNLAKKYPKVRYVRILEKGVGAAFRKGTALSRGDVVGYMDIDLSTDIRHLGNVITAFQRYPLVDYFNGSRFAKASKTRGRKWYRKILSKGLVLLLKVVLGMRSTDAICGFTFVRRATALELIQASSRENGWFYMIEFLLRAERMGKHIVDYPVRWKEDYNTTVRILPTVWNYLKQITRLFILFRFQKASPQTNRRKS
jgi:glycosyltransferase involved in cell wall biosynthesis